MFSPPHALNLPQAPAGDETLILAFDSATEACTAALFDTDGVLLDAFDEVIGRGHAERLVPMIDALLGSRRPGRILVGVGPGSFTGLRVAIAAAHGMAIGWNVPIQGLSTLGLLAATGAGGGARAAALLGGHGELFVQSFAGTPLDAIDDARNLTPANAAARTTADDVVGQGAEALVAARGWGRARAALPSASAALTLAEPLRTLPARPLYIRAPDARPRAA